MKPKQPMLFHIPQKLITVPIHEVNVANISYTGISKYLSIIFRKHLLMKTHTMHNNSKVSRTSCSLSKLKHFLPHKILWTIYNYLKSCHLNYGILVWGHAAKWVFSTQKRIISFFWLFSLVRFHHTSETSFVYVKCVYENKYILSS